eukprot:6373-Amorphochlora_amoeboformis.AAC.1
MTSPWESPGDSFGISNKLYNITTGIPPPLPDINGRLFRDWEARNPGLIFQNPSGTLTTLYSRYAYPDDLPH